MRKHIRRAAPADTPEVTAMSHELAEFERAAVQCTVWRTCTCVRDSGVWNADAIALYAANGGQPQREWTTYRLSGPELAELAGPR